MKQFRNAKTIVVSLTIVFLATATQSCTKDDELARNPTDASISKDDRPMFQISEEKSVISPTLPPTKANLKVVLGSATYGTFSVINNGGTKAGAFSIAVMNNFLEFKMISVYGIEPGQTKWFSIPDGMRSPSLPTNWTIKVDYFNDVSELYETDNSLKFYSSEIR